MGQYQQWLHLREKEQLIRTQIDTLTEELAELQAYARAFEEVENGSYQDANMAENELFRLLSLAIRPLFPWDRAPGSNSSSQKLPAVAPQPQPASRLNQSVPTAPLAPLAPSASLAPLPPLPHPEITLLPEDMAAFFDEHTQTTPQMRLPWWNRPEAATMQGNSPIDEKSERNREEIERWLARWGRQSFQHLSQGGETHE